jgi:hypothetical protein
MVAGASRHACIRQPDFSSDLGNDRLRAVPARHREPVRATLDRAAYQRLEVLAGLQLDRLDATLTSLLGDWKRGLPATGARIVERTPGAAPERWQPRGW